ncbi:MAG: tetratricopeptide repeat protein, partial [Rhodanobacter sp.]
VKDGQVLDGFAGALPEGQLREFLTRHVQPIESDPAKVSDGETSVETPEAAINRLQQSIAAEPARAELKLDLALALMGAGQVDAAQAQWDALPANLTTDARAQRLRIELELAAALKDAPDAAELQRRIEANPEDWQARDMLGVRLLHEGAAESALEQFLQILHKARDWNDGQAKKRLVAAFATLDDAELVGRYRRRMASMLF